MREKPLLDPNPAEGKRWPLATFFRKGVAYLSAIAGCICIASTANAQVGTGGLIFFGDRVVKESMASTAPITQVSAGRFFTIALRADGTVAAWGLNQSGECNITKGLTQAKQIASGRSHSLVLLANGTVQAIGLDNYGQCDVPPGLSNVTQVAAGEYTSFALKADGTIAVWGWLAANLGAPAGLTNVVEIAAGEAHVVARKSDGSVVCWGSDTHGECDYPGGPKNVIGIAAAYEHSAAIRSDGTVTCWGNNDYGQSTVPNNLIAVKIALGDTHSIAVKADGTVVGWGSSGSGETTAPTGLAGIQTVCAGSGASYGLDSNGNLFGWGDCTYGQTTIPNALYDVQKVATGSGHVMLLKHDGSLGAWGLNNEGECNLFGKAASGYTDVTAGIVHSAATGSQDPNQDVFGSNGWGQTNIPPSAGSFYDHYWAAGNTTYAHLKTGGVNAYGENNFGQLGLVPYGDFMQIAGGLFHSVGLRTDGTVVVAGTNTNGQLDVPSGLANVTQISAGYANTLCLINDGTVVGFGLNNTGQSTPPAGLTNVVQIAAGHQHSAALQSDGTVVCWGDNTFGQVSGALALTGIAQVATGEYFTVCLPGVTLAVSPYLVYGGSSATGTVYIASPAPVGGMTVTLSSNSPFASVPPSVVVPAGSSSATFTITTNGPVQLAPAIITAGLHGYSQDALLSVKPAFGVVNVSLIPSTVVGGFPSTGTVTLNQAASSSGVTVNLASDISGVTVPSSLTIPSGATSATFTANTAVVSSITTANVSSSVGSTTRSASLTATPGGLVSVSLGFSRIVGGNPDTGNVTLSGPAPVGGTVVALISGGASASVPLTVTVLAGATSATFPITTIGVDNAVSLGITATLGTIVKTTSLVVNPAAMTNFTVTPSTVSGGVASSGTVLLNGQAGPSGVVVTLSSNMSAATVPASVTIVAGATTGSFIVNTSVVSVTTTAILAATYGLTTHNSLTITPGGLNTVSLSFSHVVGGNPDTGTVTLSGPAPTGGAVVSLSSSSTSTSVPPTVTVLAGANSASFAITTIGVDAVTSATISGTLGSTLKSAVLAVNPAVMLSLVVAPTLVAGGTSALGTVVLNGQAGPSGVVATLSSNSSAASVPPSLSIVSGSTQGVFTINTAVVSTTTNAVLAATCGSTTHTAITVTAGGLLYLTVSSSNVVGGNPDTGTITISGPAPAGGTVVTLSSSSASASVPVSATVLAGATSANFTITTVGVDTATAVTLSASLGAITKTAGISVNPSAMIHFTVAPSSVAGGTSGLGTVVLNGQAGPSGVVVALGSNIGAASVPASVTIPSGATQASFAIGTSVVASTTNAVLAATYGSTTHNSLTITSGGLVSVSLNFSHIVGGNGDTGSVTISGPAPTGGVTVALSSDNGCAGVPVYVTILEGATSASFPITSVGVDGATLANISATLGSVAKSAGLTVNPAAMIGFNVSPSSVAGGTPTTGTILLNGQAGPSGIVVALSSNNPAATVPVSMQILSGATSGSFSITTSSVAALTTAILAATFGSTTHASLTVTVN